MSEETAGIDESFPEIGGLTNAELKDMIDELTAEESRVSYRRRILHGKIDILRAELVSRLRESRESGDATISGGDVQRLTEILLGKVPGEGDE